MQDYVERLLIVLNADKTLKGAAQYRLTVLDDGRAFQGEAQPVAPDALSAVLPDQAGLTAQVSALLLTQADLARQIEQLTNERDRVTAERDQAQAALADMTHRYEAATEQLQSGQVP